MEAEYNAILEAKTGAIVYFNDLCRRWLQTKRKSVSARTYDGYARIVENYLLKKDGLAVREFVLITSFDIQNYYETVLASASNTMIRKVNAILSMIYTQAGRWGLCSKNPAKASISAKLTKERSSGSNLMTILPYSRHVRPGRNSYLSFALKPV